MNRFRALLPLWIGLALVTTANSQEQLKKYWQTRFGGQEMQVRDVEGLTQRIVDGKLHLHLKDFFALVLQNAPDIQLTRLDVYTPANELISARAPFNPALNLSFNAVRSVSPLSYSISGSPSGGQFTLPQTINSLSQTSTLDYQQLLPTGQKFESTFTGYRSSGDGYPYPSLFGVLNFQITQPLLQNRRNLQYLTPIRVARTEILISAKQSEATITTAIAQYAQQYWDAILARENIRVDQQALDLARKSYDHDKQALDLGAISKLDIFQSETQVAERERDLVQAQYQYKVLLDGLRRLIGADLTPEMRSTEIVLDDDPSALPDKSVILPFEQALEKALKARPEAAAASAAVTVDDLNARASRDQLLPRLDLGLQGGSSGPGLNQLSLGGVVGLTSVTPTPGLGPTLQQVLNFSYPTYGFSVSATFPFHNSTAQASLADALVNRARDRYRQRQTQEQITLDVRQAIHSLELADATILAAVRARDFARENVDAEQQKYQLGSITAFELLDSQSRLASSESALVTAYVSYQEAYVSYERATQTLLDAFGMVVNLPKMN
ncbi:MAG TPA: TolC family protein [Bryobacteraceae bacterium]|jgi:outer membrane protein TolC|nr:TolC family protein [Bryobacteraceae bacterium]